MKIRFIVMFAVGLVLGGMQFTPNVAFADLARENDKCEKNDECFGKLVCDTNYGKCVKPPNAAELEAKNKENAAKERGYQARLASTIASHPEWLQVAKDVGFVPKDKSVDSTTAYAVVKAIEDKFVEEKAGDPTVAQQKLALVEARIAADANFDAEERYLNAFFGGRGAVSSGESCEGGGSITWSYAGPTKKPAKKKGGGGQSTAAAKLAANADFQKCFRDGNCAAVCSDKDYAFLDACKTSAASSSSSGQPGGSSSGAGQTTSPTGATSSTDEPVTPAIPRPATTH